MSYAPSLLTVRAHFDLTQRELAAWLGLSRQQLTRIEASTDPLPAHARPWLWPWLTALHDQLAAPGLAPDPDPDPAPSPLPDPPAAGPAPLLARWHECQFQAEALRGQLAAEQHRHRTWRRRLTAGPTLLAALPPTAAADEALPARHRWLTRLLEAATDGLHPTHPTAGPTTEALLAARRSAYLHEANWLATYLTAGADGVA